MQRLRTITIVLLFLSTSSLAASPPPPLAAWLPDAELTDIFFHNPDEGWAVGDRGVIWQTLDGGHHWERRESGLTARLEAIQFIDRMHGWIVGGWTLPYSQRSRAVVLRTTDGGASWNAVPHLRIPRLNAIRFLNSQTGWAVGENSTLYPSGVFRTEDGGRNWTTVVQGHSQPWLAGDFFGPDSGLVAGAGGMVARVSRTQVVPSERPRWGARRLNCLKLSGPTTAWLVGAGGLIATSHDGGRQWQPPAGTIPLQLPGQFDFHDIATLGDQCWIVGNPGTVVLYSADAGKSWQRQNTGQSLPLHRIHFIDPQRGWAVGALGTILATRDGGQSWQRQKGGGKRAAMMGIFGSEQTAVYELFCLLSAHDGYLGVGQLVTTPTHGPGDMYARWRESISLSGGSAAEQIFTMPRLSEELSINPERLAANWDRAVDGSYRAVLDRQLVRSIRSWRPSVIVTEPAGPRATAVQQAIQQAVTLAVSHAADATWYPDQLTDAGLTSWQVDRLLAVELERRPSTTINSSQLVPSLGMSVAQFASRARSLTQSQLQVVPASIGFTTISADRLADGPGRGIMAGSGLAPGGEARRNINNSATEDVRSLVESSRRWRNMQQIIDRGVAGTIPTVSLIGQLDDVLKDMRVTDAGQIMFQLGHQYQRQGRLDLSAEILDALLTRYPRHELAEAAAVELMQYYASGEVAWQMRRQSSFASGQVDLAIGDSQHDPGLAAGDNSVLPATAVLDDNKPQPTVRQAVVAQPRTLAVVESAETDGGSSERSRLALQLARRLQQDHPELFLSPEFRFPLSVAQRRFGTPRDAERIFHQLAGSRRDAWRQCAQVELWFLHGRGLPPKPMISSQTASARPLLDGLLNEPAWQASEPIHLKSPLSDDEQHPATLRIMHDPNYLYFGVHCQKAAEARYPVDQRPRQRDSDLQMHDRIELLLDVDRDYVSFYRLVIDHRGWANESCWRDSGWNPRWYIARAANQQSWTVEIAIPWNQLTASAPRNRATWALAVQRIIPGVGFQSWTPRSNQTGEQAGLLLFQ
jgi:photosystem II stability/assembly factor-like uncharacterized protein